jgi:hypothetical protein
MQKIVDELNSKKNNKVINNSVNKVVQKKESTIETKNNVESKSEIYKVKSLSVKLYLDKSFKTLTAWVKAGDQVEIIEDL